MVSASSLIPIVTGPTASGKSRVALRLAETDPHIEIISIDSVAVYRGFDIGSAKPSIAERSRIRHHLIDIRDPFENFTAGDLVRETENAIQDIHQRGKRPLLVGGTVFYVRALLFGMWDAPGTDPALRAKLESVESPVLYAELLREDPAAAARIHPNDRYRLIRAVEILRTSGIPPSRLDSERPRTPDQRFSLWILDPPREELMRRIQVRTREMLDNGLLEETRHLRQLFPDAKALDSIGYAQACAYLDKISPQGRTLRPGRDGLEDEIQLATRQLTKTQRTFLKSFTFARRFESADALVNSLLESTLDRVNVPTPNE